jgi:hypothetical protein
MIICFVRTALFHSQFYGKKNSCSIRFEISFLLSASSQLIQLQRIKLNAAVTLSHAWSQRPVEIRRSVLCWSTFIPLSQKKCSHIMFWHFTGICSVLHTPLTKEGASFSNSTNLSNPTRMVWYFKRNSQLVNYGASPSTFLRSSLLTHVELLRYSLGVTYLVMCSLLNHCSNCKRATNESLSSLRSL